jgi:hypothetical protein
LIAVLLSWAMGCGMAPTEAPPEPEVVAAPAPASKAQQAAAVANAIASGTPADKAIADQGLTDDSFRELLYDIAEDPASTEEYLAARH